MNNFEQPSLTWTPENLVIFDAPMPEIVDDLAPYYGEWVAVSESGHVLAHNRHPGRLLEDPGLSSRGDYELIPVNRGTRLGNGLTRLRQ